MRQVPMTANVTPYTLVGDGRMARHFSHYLSLLAIPYQQWSRRADPQALELPHVLQHSQRVLLLISDDAIAPFYHKHIRHYADRLICLHASGCVTVPGVIGAHPLMTFGVTLYPLAAYLSIPFMLECRVDEIGQVLPGLNNPHYYIPSSDKALYHALCVLSGNFTTLLWQKIFADFAKHWQITPQAILPYLQRITQNLAQDPANALTGPLVRADMQTLQANMNALSGDAYQQVYAAFVQAYQQSRCPQPEGDTHADDYC